MPSDPSSERRRKARAEQGLSADARPTTIGPLRAPTTSPSARTEPQRPPANELAEIRDLLTEMNDRQKSGGLFRSGQFALITSVAVGVTVGMILFTWLGALVALFVADLRGATP